MESTIVNLAVVDAVRLSGIDFRKLKPGRAFSFNHASYTVCAHVRYIK